MANSKENIQNRLESLRKAYHRKLPDQIKEAEESWSRLIRGENDDKTLTHLHRTIHTIAGSCATFGFSSLSSIARRIDVHLKTLMDHPAVPPVSLMEDISKYMEELKRVSSEDPEHIIAAPTSDCLIGRQSTSPAYRSTKLIFIIEDDIHLLKYLETQISHFGYEVRTFSELGSLDSAFEEEVPSVVLVDIVFPEGCFAGTALMRQIQEKFERPIPTVFISSQNDLDTRLQSVRAGGDAFFMKPVNIIELIDKLDSLTTCVEPEPYRILIVDDEPELAAYYSSILEQAGMRTAIVNKPMLVLDPLIEFKPDLILMDMYMPGCNGQELAKAIRQMGAFFSIPIIFLSAETNIDRQLNAMRMGGDDFLTKPIQPDHLISSVAIRAERMRIMRAQMERDGLTGLLNHTKTREQLQVAVERARRLKSPLTFAMADIDHFKMINDTYGHPTGDRVIVGLSRLLQQRLRVTDIIGRYGGEEFALVLMDTEMEDALNVLERIRESFSQIKHHSDRACFSVTFSCGLAGFPRCQDAVSLSNAADKALYEAKNGGRNRIVVI